jgi:hypothetical protein
MFSLLKGYYLYMSFCTHGDFAITCPLCFKEVSAEMKKQLKKTKKKRTKK